MPESFDETLQIQPYRYAGTWLIGASTRAIDRFVPDVERIFQPAREHIGGTIHFHLGQQPGLIRARSAGTRKLRLRNFIHQPRLIALGDRILFDVRADNYFNWSHQVNFFLTLALAARSHVDEPVTIVLPSRMPRVALDLYQQFGFDVVSTDGPVKGRNFHWEVSDRQVVSSGRPQLIAPFMSRHDEDPAVFPSFDLPAKVFLARRGTRSLLNEGEIEELLAQDGFSKVYAEDLSVPQQFALFRQAEHVVAIHGAGLAPLEYRSPSKPGMRLIELAPPGIMTRWFGIMCEQVGGKYIAVRGRLKPEYVSDFYAPTFSEKYCNDDFEIDPKSLEVALEMIESTQSRAFAVE
jgi:Glycosyltransferase 61